MIKKITTSNPQALDSLAYDDFEFELDGTFLDELYLSFSHYKICILKKTVKLEIVSMQKIGTTVAFVLRITSRLCMPVKQIEELTKIEVIRAMNKELSSLFDKFQIRYMYDNFNLTVEYSDFYLIACVMLVQEGFTWRAQF